MLKKAIFYCAAAASLTAPAFAEDDKEVSILAALGLTAASGKTTLADGAGDMEGVILTTAMFTKAIEKLKTQIETDTVNGYAKHRFVILDHDDPFDVSLSGLVTNRIKKAIPEKIACDKDPVSPDTGYGILGFDGGQPINTSAVGLAATAIGMLKTDTEISSYTVTVPEHHLISSVAVGFPDRAILPGEIAVMPDLSNSDVVQSFGVLLETRAKLKPCAQEDAAKKQIEKIDAVVAAITAPGKDDSPSLLERAAKQGILTSQGPLLVLRLNMEKAGGTVVNRSNIFLQFGFPGALVIHNGMKLNYRLVDPTKGLVIGAGSILCRQPKSQRFETVYRKSLADLKAAADCEPV